MVGVVQLVERQVVILNVAGSSPVTHPTGQGVFGPLEGDESSAGSISPRLFVTAQSKVD
jgi:hypothetical protein